MLAAARARRALGSRLDLRGLRARRFAIGAARERGLLAASKPIVVRSQHEMEQLGAQVARACRIGDVLFLKGDLGCGKTCFARGFIRAQTQDAALQVTSPTYLLVNTYDLPSAGTSSSSAIYHVDLYRIDSVSEQDKAALGLADAFANGISLVEWPERFDAASVPPQRLDVHIQYSDDSGSSREDRRSDESMAADTDDGASVRTVTLRPFGERWTSRFGA